MARTYLLWGAQGTGKTSFALADATTEAPVAYKELEPGGFSRANKRLKLNESQVLVEKFPTPLQELEVLLGGTPTLGGKGGLHADFSYQLDGWAELLNGIVYSMMNSSKLGQRPVFDTGTRFWLIVRNGYEELVQKATGAEVEKLGQLKYTWPNKVHLQVHEFPIQYDLDLIWIAHETTEFGSDPPIYKADCWKELPGLVDVSLRFFVRNSKPWARIEKGAEVGMTVKGLEIEEPTLKKLNGLLDMVGIVESEGDEDDKANIRNVDWLLAQAKLRGL